MAAASEEAFKLVGEAFRVLSDSALKKGYDAELRKKEAPTFWTACSACRLLHQFERRYVGHSLVCPNCNKSFEAVEAVLSDGSSDEGEKVGVRRNEKREVVLGVAAPNGVKGKVGGEKGLKGKVGDGDGVGDVGGGGSKKRMRSVGDVLERSKPKGIITGEETMTLAEFQSQVKRKVQQEKVKVKDKEEEWGRTDKRSSRKRVENKRGLEIGEVRTLKLPIKENAVKSKRGSEVGEERSLKKNVKLAIKEKPEASGKRKRLELEECGDANGGELEVMAVVDSDFYDFDKDRVERSFKKGQVWAAYDDDDGMPRHYALIDETVSANPFEVRISWLDLQSNADGKIVSREKMGFHIPCGRFKVARKDSINSVNIFSHVVDCDRVAREVYKIYPRKGSVWALYGEATLDADGRHFADEGKRCYDIVVFLTNYNEMNGLSMAYLEKVDGYKTVFKRQDTGSHAIRFLGKDNMWLISHQIPARKSPCIDETPELLEDCWELDPASLPSYLLTIGGIDN